MQTTEQVYGQVQRQVGDQVRWSVQVQVWGQVELQVRFHVEDELNKVKKRSSDGVAR